MDYSLELLEKVYTDCLDKPEGERLAFLEQTCSDNPHLKQTIIKLLDADEPADSFFKHFQKTIAGAIASEKFPPWGPGTRVGKYTISKLIGKGGMSNVYLAERSDGEFEQKVAIKCLPPEVVIGKHSAFDKAEQQLLAKLQHPSIANLYDAGKTDDGIAYFIMEYIDGDRVDQYTEERKLSQRNRLSLFLHVAEAVAYAHRHLILHLDLKASNVMVTKSGQVKLLDFGISTALNDSNVQDGVFHGTPQIAAPEQFTNEPVTMATDVYQLGSLLHQLLTGKLPGDDNEKLKGITRRDISFNMSSEKKSLGSVSFELRAIIDQCLALKPSDRYASVYELTKDIKNFLTHYPVNAVKDGRTYIINRFVRRNRAAILSAAIVAVSLLTGTVLSLWQAGIAREQRDRAIKNEQVTAATKNFLLDMFMAAHPSKSKGDTLTVFEFLDMGYEQSATYDASPEIKLEMLTTFGKLYRSLGDYKKSGTVLDSALAYARRADIPVATSYIQAVEQLALYQRDLGNYDSARTLFSNVMQLYDEIKYPHLDSNYTASLKYLAYLLKMQNQFDSSLLIVKQAIALEEALWPERNNLKLAESYYILGTIYKDQGMYDEAVTYLSKSLSLCETLMGTNYPGTLANLNTISFVYQQASKHDSALTYSQRTPRIAVKVFGTNHSETATTFANLGKLYLSLKQYDSAYVHLSRAYRIRSKIYLSNPNISTIIGLNNLIEVFNSTGQEDSARYYLNKALEMSRSERIQDRQRVITYKLAGDLLKLSGKYDSALYYYQQSLTTSSNMMKDDDPRITYLQEQIQQLDSLKSVKGLP